ncbi:carboxymuconolactone decarboxylase family protein [Phycicoccus endophyticus]|nr:carboxymuconolactone decarboxylase family protein [Phycicoccus endophyticus]
MTRETTEDRISRGRRIYARNLGIPEAEAETRMSALAGHEFVREAYLAAGGTSWSSPELSDRDRALAVVAALVAQHVVDERLDPYLALARGAGVTEDGLDALMVLLSAYLGQPATSRGAAAVHRTRSARDD